MPQLIPFYFVNQLSFALLAIIYLIFIMSKSVLPYFTLQQVIRVYITKLANTDKQLTIKISKYRQIIYTKPMMIIN